MVELSSTELDEPANGATNDRDFFFVLRCADSERKRGKGRGVVSRALRLGQQKPESLTSTEMGLDVRGDICTACLDNPQTAAVVQRLCGEAKERNIKKV